MCRKAHDTAEIKYARPRSDVGVKAKGDGLYEGYGTLKFPNGSVCEGHFHKGVFHGQGNYIFTNMTTYQGRHRYTGGFKEGLFHDVTGDATLYYLGGMAFIQAASRMGFGMVFGKLTYTDGKVSGMYCNDHCTRQGL